MRAMKLRFGLSAKLVLVSALGLACSAKSTAGSGLRALDRRDASTPVLDAGPDAELPSDVAPRDGGEHTAGSSTTTNSEPTSNASPLRDAGPRQSDSMSIDDAGLDDDPSMTAMDASALHDVDDRADDGPRDGGDSHAPADPFDDAGGGDDLVADNDDLTDEPASDPTDDTVVDPTDAFDGEGGAPACGTDTACEQPECVQLAASQSPPTLQVGDPCSNGVGACARAGSWQTANDGSMSCDAVAGEASAEVCNGLDDDCNGAADDGLDASISEETLFVDYPAAWTGLAKATRGGALTACFLGPQNSIDCTDSGTSEPRTPSQSFTHDLQINGFDFTFDPAGQPMFCFTSGPTSWAGDLNVAHRDAQSGQYTVVKVASDAQWNCDIELDAEGTLQVHYTSSIDNEPRTLSLEGSCDGGTYAPVETQLEALPQVYHDPDPPPFTPADSIPTLTIYPDLANQERVILDMGPQFISETVVPVDTESYTYWNPSFVLLPDARRWVTLDENYDSQMLMCGDSCYRRQVMLYRMEAFVGALYPAIESSVLAEDASVLSGGLVRSSSGAVSQLYTRGGSVFRVFICG